MWKFQYFLSALIDDGVLFILFPIYLQSDEENLSSVNRSVSEEKHKQRVTSTLMRSLFVLICCSCTFLLHSSVRSRFFPSQSPQLAVDVFQVCLFGASFAAFCAVWRRATGTANHLEKWHRWMWGELWWEHLSAAWVSPTDETHRRPAFPTIFTALDPC